MSANLYAQLRGRFMAEPEAVFLESPGGATLSFAALDDTTARLNALLREHGVTAGDRVVMQVEKGPLALALYLACLRAGAVAVTLNTAYTASEVAFFLSDAEPAVFVCDPGRAGELDGVAKQAGVPSLLTLDGGGRGSIDRFRELDPALEIVPREPDDPAAILYTSGTTGRSKGAVLSHANLSSNALTLHELWRFEPGDVLLHALPIFHAHGLFVALHTALLNASRVILLPRFDAAEVVRRLPEATVFMGVPTFYTRLLEQPGLGREACRKMRLFLAGSAPLLADTHREFEARTGHRILERYGMTEAGMITSNPYDGERVPGSVGFPLPGVEVRVVDESGRSCEPGETGGLEIRGPNVFRGYWRMPEKTREEFRPDGFFITGDLAVQDEAGRLTLVGRSKDLVITGGYNVYPREIEQAIDAIPGVGESAVFGVPHPDFGEGLTAAVVPDGSRELQEADVLEPLRARLARFKQPKRLFLLENLPRNAMGKVQKNLLRDEYADIYVRGEPEGPPETNARSESTSDG